MILQTERLVLRELTDEDAPFILALVNSAAFRENIGDRGVRDLDGALGYIARVRESYANNGFGLWRAALKATDESIGVCGIVKRDALPLPDVGYALLETFWGRGYATEGAAAVIDHGLGRLGIPVIAAITKPGNAGSISVLEKIGMQHLGPRQLQGHDEESVYFETI